MRPARRRIRCYGRRERPSAKVSDTRRRRSGKSNSRPPVQRRRLRTSEGRVRTSHRRVRSSGRHVRWSRTASPNFGATPPNFGGTCPVIRTTCPVVWTACPAVRTTYPNFGATYPNFGAACPDFGGTCPNFGATSPNFGGTCPVVRRPSSRRATGVRACGSGRPMPPASTGRRYPARQTAPWPPFPGSPSKHRPDRSPLVRSCGHLMPRFQRTPGRLPCQPSQSRLVQRQHRPMGRLLARGRRRVVLQQPPHLPVSRANAPSTGPSSR